MNKLDGMQNFTQDDKKIQIVYTWWTFLSTESEDGSRAIWNIDEKLPAVLTATMDELKKIFNIEETEIYKIDSSDLSLDHLYKLKNFIETSEEKNKNSISDYIIVHGTDTMEYTASYLSLAFPNFEKNIILTGSMIPVGSKNSDAIPNLFKSLVLSGEKKPGVSVVFGDKCIKWINASKQDSVWVNAFDSISSPPQYTIITNPDGHENVSNGKEYVFQWNRYVIKENVDTENQLLRNNDHYPKELARELLDTLNSNIDIITLFPGYNYDNFDSYIDRGIEWLIIKWYWDGNVPQDKKFYEKLKKLKDSWILVILETQVPNGKLLHNYEGARNLLDNGLAISAGNLSHSTVVIKLMLALWDKNKKITEGKFVSNEEALEYTKQIFKTDFAWEYSK
jgi:L-asparaginase/Glu-tRNA(Gln) amidotransferase subunit D